MRPWTLLVSFLRLTSPTISGNESHDPTGSLGIVSVWSTAEANLGIVSACMPTLKPLLRRFIPQGKHRNAIPKPAGSGSSGSKKYLPSATSHGSSSIRFPKLGRGDQHFRELTGDSSLAHLPRGMDGTGTQTHITSTRGKDQSAEEVGIPLNAIEVRTNMDWQQSE